MSLDTIDRREEEEKNNSQHLYSAYTVPNAANQAFYVLFWS